MIYDISDMHDISLYEILPLICQVRYHPFYRDISGKLVIYHKISSRHINFTYQFFDIP